MSRCCSKDDGDAITDRDGKHATIFILIDGLADVSIPERGYRTPLELASTPAMDAIACAGLNGLLDPVAPGLACGSDTAHMSILGYPPQVYYRGRGAFEAMGAGLKMLQGDVAFKCNFATIEESVHNPLVLRRRVDRNFSKWGKELCPFLNGVQLPSFPEVQVFVQYATEHRCGIVIRGPGLTDAITGTDPLKDNLPLQVSCPLDREDGRGIYTSKVLNELSQTIHDHLRAHPINDARRLKNEPVANIILLRGPGGRMKNVQSFDAQHEVKSFMIAPTCIIAGLGISLDMEILTARGATGDYHTDFMSKGKRALEALDDPKNYTFGFIHTKAVDDAGHDRDLDKKIYFLEQIDRMIAMLVRELALRSISNRKSFSIVITGDHSTPVQYGDHSFEPVPFVISTVHSAAQLLEQKQQHNDGTCKTSGKTMADPLMDSVRSFSEIAAHQGYLGRFPGDEVMPIIRKYSTYVHPSAT